MRSSQQCTEAATRHLALSILRRCASEPDIPPCGPPRNYLKECTAFLQVNTLAGNTLSVERRPNALVPDLEALPSPYTGRHSNVGKRLNSISHHAHATACIKHGVYFWRRLFFLSRQRRLFPMLDAWVRRLWVRHTRQAGNRGLRMILSEGEDSNVDSLQFVFQRPRPFTSHHLSKAAPEHVSFRCGP